MTEPVKKWVFLNNQSMTEPVGPSLDHLPRYVLAADYARLEQECEDARCQAELMQRAAEVFREDRDAALKQVDGLRAALVEARELIAHGDFDTGICCCGDDVDKHGFGDGHSPVDEGGYYALGVMQRIDAALQAKP